MCNRDYDKQEARKIKLHNALVCGLELFIGATALTTTCNLVAAGVNYGGEIYHDTRVTQEQRLQFRETKNANLGMVWIFGVTTITASALGVALGLDAYKEERLIKWQPLTKEKLDEYERVRKESEF